MVAPNRFPPGRFARLWADRTMTLRQIADVVGYSDTDSVRRKARALGLPVRPEKPGRPPVWRGREAEFKAMIEAGFTQRQMSILLGVTQQAVSGALRAFGQNMA